MGLYEKYVLPKFINCACGMQPIMRQREKAAPLARGRVLEIGMGSGLKLSFYDKYKVEMVSSLASGEKMCSQTLADRQH